MGQIMRAAPRVAVYLLLFFAVTCWAGPTLGTAQAQCVDSSQVNNFKVRSVKFKTLFGLIPKDLAQQLESHRGDDYSAQKASDYIGEIRRFYSTDPAQLKYERLIANKLKLSIKAGRTWLECVEKIDPAECQKLFPGSPGCVDVTIKRYFVDVDALNASPYLLLFPRSGLAALYGAMPRPLLALNPDLDVSHDKRFGPAPSIDTATDLLDLSQIFGSDETAAPGPTPTPVQPATPDEDLEATFEFGGTGSSSQQEEPAADPPARDTKLLLRLRGLKSLTERFYDTATELNFSRTKPLNWLQDAGVDLGFAASRVPQGEDDYFRNAAWLDFNTDLRLRKSPVKLIQLGGGYRWSRNQLFSGNGSFAPQINSENAFKVRALADGAVAKGLTRAAVWYESNNFAHAPGSYRRFAALTGYGKEFVISRKKHFHEISPPELDRPCWTSYPDAKLGEARKNESTIGVEFLAGAGRTWGDVPGYARFFGGSPLGQFLYDELSARTVTTFPFGPVLRSLGKNEAGIGPANITLGGTSYWHANVNLSIPVPRWSRPLIPHEWVAVSSMREGDEEFAGHAPAGASICRDLKSTVKTLVRVSGANLMVSQQARDRLTDQEKSDLRLVNKADRTPDEERRLQAATEALAAAKAKVQPEIQSLFDTEILPITDFIADYANIFAVKPLLLFDVAHLGPASADTPTRYGAGGGIQLDIVMARFEFGYVAALNRAPGDPRGNFFGRLVLRRLF